MNATTISTTKTRISKKALAALPTAVAETVRGIGESHGGVKSFTFHAVTTDHQFMPWENEQWFVIMADEQRSIETAAEHRLGAAGQYAFGAKFSAPAGAFVLRISYYTKYFLDIYNVQEIAPALPEPQPIAAALPEVAADTPVTFAERVKSADELAFEDSLMHQAYSHSVECRKCRGLFVAAYCSEGVTLVSSYPGYEDALDFLHDRGGFAIFQDGDLKYLRQNFGTPGRYDSP